MSEESQPASRPFPALRTHVRQGLVHGLLIGTAGVVLVALMLPAGSWPVVVWLIPLGTAVAGLVGVLAFRVWWLNRNKPGPVGTLTRVSGYVLGGAFALWAGWDIITSMARRIGGAF